MVLAGGIGEIYLISTAIGVIYFVFGILMGQLHGLAHSHVGHGHSAIDVSGAHGAAHHAGPAAGAAQHHTPGVAAHHHTAAGAAHQHAAGGAAHHRTADGGLPGDERGHAIHPPHVDHAHDVDVSSTGSHAPFHLKTSWRALLLTLLNPMTLAIFLAFFGLTGLLVLRLLPFFGVLSCIPAALIAFVITGRLLNLFAWLLLKAGASSEGRIENLIGQMGQVTVPIKEGRTGEIACVMGSKRYNYPARAKTKEDAFAVASFVMVSDLKGGVAYVEPWTDAILQTDTGCIIEIPDVVRESPDQRP